MVWFEINPKEAVRRWVNDTHKIPKHSITLDEEQINISTKQFLIFSRKYFQKDMHTYNKLNIQRHRGFLFSEIGIFPRLRHFLKRTVRSRLSWEIRLNSQDE